VATEENPAILDENCGGIVRDLAVQGFPVRPFFEFVIASFSFK